jgi:radical SAM superfamily enzyme YgiQ (UPF0313 family)
VEAIAHLVGRIRAAGRAARATPRLRISLSTFVPKAHTPFQWAAMPAADILEDRIDLLKGELRPLKIAVEGESAAWSRVQGVLARGDRRLAQVLAHMEKPSLGRWRRALKRSGLSEEEYLRQRTPEEHLPWSFIHAAAPQKYLWNMWQRAQDNLSSPPCPTDENCTRCGLCA